MDDLQAIATLKQGNLIGLEVLVRRYQTKALQSALMIVQDQAAAEDVVHQSFLKVYDNIRSFRDGYPFAPWFFRIVMNQAINVVRQRARLTSLDEEADEMTAAPWIIDPQPSPEELVEQLESFQELRSALSKLKPEYRAVLVMRYYLGYDYKATAERINQPLSTIKMWLHNAKKNLREILQ